MHTTATPTQAWHAPAGLRPGSARRCWAGQGDQQRPGCNAPAPTQGRTRTGVAGMGRPRRGTGGAEPGRTRRGLITTGVDNGFRGEAWLGLAGQCSAQQGEARRDGVARCGARSGMAGLARRAWVGLGRDFIGVDEASGARLGRASLGLVRRGEACLGKARGGRLAVPEVRDLSAHAQPRGAAGTGPARRGLAGLGAARQGLGRLAEIAVRLLDAHARPGVARYGLAIRGGAGRGKSGQCGAPHGMARRGLAGTPLRIDGVDKLSWRGAARSGRAWHGVAGHRRCEASLGLARCGLAMRGRDLSVWTDFRGWARRGLVVLGTARQGQARTGVAGQASARCGKAWYGVAGTPSSVSGATPERPTQHLWAGQGIGSCWVRHGSVGRGRASQGQARQGTPVWTDVHGWAWHGSCWDPQASAGRGMELLHLGRTG